MNNELMHFGIHGMKWGVRRYQNSDGTLTDEGKKRYNENDSFERKIAKQKDETTEKYANRHKRVIAVNAALAGAATVASTLAVLGGRKMLGLETSKGEALKIAGKNAARASLGVLGAEAAMQLHRVTRDRKEQKQLERYRNAKTDYEKRNAASKLENLSKTAEVQMLWDKHKTFIV